MRRLSWAAAAALLVLTAGCGSDSDDGPKADPNPSATETSGASELDLADGLLTIDDVPAGLEEIEPDDDESALELVTGDPGCQELLDADFGDDADDKAEAEFEDPTTGFSVSSIVSSYDDGVIEEILDDFETVIAGCTEATVAIGDQEAQIRVTSVDVSRLGDRSAAALMELGQDGQKLGEFYLTVTSVGEYSTVTNVFTAEPIDLTIVDDLNEVAVDRLSELVAGSAV